jgi:hypothetical protein
MEVHLALSLIAEELTSWLLHTTMEDLEEWLPIPISIKMANMGTKVQNCILLYEYQASSVQVGLLANSKNWQ